MLFLENRKPAGRSSTNIIGSIGHQSQKLDQPSAAIGSSNLDEDSKLMQVFHEMVGNDGSSKDYLKQTWLRKMNVGGRLKRSVPAVIGET